ncbi:MAG: flagellar motor protein MotB [bacterium]|jgi:flagellar motor protein MotB
MKSSGKVPQRRQQKDGDWLLTFADLFTLLFCFFVLLTTLSTQPKDCQSLKEYLDSNRKQYKNYELRSTKLECIISLPSDFLFRSGSAEIQRRALSTIGSLFRTIKRMPEHENDLVIVEGHTDDIPIRTKRFPSNWELSSARATELSTFLINQMKYKGDSVSIRAFAAFKSKASYFDDTGKRLKGTKLKKVRQRNRRVEIILVNKPKSLATSKLLFDGK